MPDQADATQLPFQVFSFTLVEDRRPRAAMRMTANGDGSYELHVERGPASQPSQQFTRTVPLEIAQRLNDALQVAGVFGWEESYGDASAPGSRRWSLSIVFREGVFSLASKGGSDVPAGFGDVLEELYRLDFPRPNGAADALTPGQTGQVAGHGIGAALNTMGSLGYGGFGGMSAGDIGAYGAAGKAGFGGMDFSRLQDLAQGSGMSDLLGEAQRDPGAFQERMKEEFRHMSPDEQNRLLDALASTGMASRAWWERFLRGY